ncbi:MAG: hypothetical protein AAGE84_05190 [Cyanobacteria bacterium P01_G01_bin.39]
MAEISECNTVTNIIGEYQCAGECVVTVDGKKELRSVSGETDSIEYFPSSDKIYQVEINGGNDFSETEIGSLVGNTLRTATAQVSDNQFPVLEEYIFEADLSGQAKSFTKIVRNPSLRNFKSCNIQCKK